MTKTAATTTAMAMAMMISEVKIPEKSFFKADEVCGLVGVRPYVLRFWESKFDQIAPMTSSSGQKLYGHKDIEAIARVKKLLFKEKMTVEEAQKGLASALPSPSPSLPAAGGAAQKLALAKAKLQALLSMMEALKKRHNWT